MLLDEINIILNIKFFLMDNLVFNKKNNSIQKINLTLKKEKHSILKNNINTIGKYFICPKCNVNIPSLPFFINPIESGSIEILINCRCGNKDRMPLEDYFNFKIPVANINICEECNSNRPNLNCLYCIDCSKWICEDCRKYFKETEKDHNYSEYPVIFSQLCNAHINHENLFFCATCNKELCIKCTKNHQTKHKIINLIDYYNKVKELHSIKNIENRINSFNNKNEELKKKCLDNFERIEMEYENSYIELNDDSKDINIEREAFLEIYNKNIILNKQLNKFIHALYNIFILAQEHPNYNIIHNLEISSFINDNFPDIEFENKNNSNNYYVTMYKKIYKYFRENYLLSIKSLILMKEEKVYLDKYNIKHLFKINEESIILTTDSCFQIFSIKTKEFSPIINEHNKEITKIIKLKNGNIVTASKDGHIKIWSLENSISFKNSLTCHDEEIIELLELSDGNLLSVDKIGKLIIWDINKYKQIQMILLNLND
jgi:WD40 repeat protein